MLYRSALQRQIDLLEEELADFERGRLRVSKRIDGNISWDDITHLTMLRTQSRIDALQDIAEKLPKDL